jgi:hypothetical protein
LAGVVRLAMRVGIAHRPDGLTGFPKDIRPSRSIAFHRK